MLAPGGAAAGTYVVSIQPDTATSDSYLREDNDDEKNGDKPQMDLAAGSDSKNRQPIVRIPLAGLAGKTVVQAWLRLTQFNSSASSPIDARAHALTESWHESTVTWRYRSGTTPWATPGGTRTSAWTDRVPLGSGTLGEVAWQVGPIVQAWQQGTLPNHGLVVVPDRRSPTRVVELRSSEIGIASARPRLVVHYTDEAPAVREATAEIQPRAVQSGAANTPLTLWLDVDALGATPSGLPTGFDALTLVHRGALVITGVDGMTVAGVPVLPATVSWSETGQAAVFRFPRVRTTGQVRLLLRATVLAAAAPGGVDMPVLLDDTSTPGAWAQAVWSGDADRLAGNGDDWILTVTSSPTVRVDLAPDAAALVNRTCASFGFFGEDAAGNRYTLTPDSVKVVPPSAGTMSVDGTFCASAPGTAKVFAYYQSFRDSSTVTVQPALTPAFGPPVLRTLAGGVTSTLVPGDTMLVDLDVSEGDGFRDVREVRFDLFHTGHASAGAAPAFHAAFRWRRGDPVPWRLLDPVSSTWGVVPDLCVADSASNSTAPHLVRLAFTVGRIARASSAGEWNVAARVLSATPADTTSNGRAGLDAAASVTLALSDDATRFSPANPGTPRVPLSDPPSGAVDLKVWANDAFRLEGRAADLVGASVPGETLFVHRSGQPLAWAFDPQGAGGGSLDTTAATLLSGPAPVAEAPAGKSLHLWSDYPAGLTPQDYRGTLRLEASLPAFPAARAARTASLTATLVSAGLSAQGALAEVTPHLVTAGAATVFDAYLLPDVAGGDTGVNWIGITLPAGYGAPTVTSVRVSGAAVPFADSSGPGKAVAVFAPNARDGQLVRVRFSATAPTATDTAGGDFAVAFDDTSTSVPAQNAEEGDANLVADGDDWRVRVGPAAVATLAVSPGFLDCPVDSVVAFTAAGWDAWGNAAPPSATWSVSGGIGSVGAGGAFAARTRGTGFVVARSGAAADSAAVTVHPLPAIAVRALAGPASVVPGQQGIPIDVRVENLSDQDVRLDSLALSFTRTARGDADAEMPVATPPSLPLLIPADGSATVSFVVGASLTAAPGTVVFVDAAAAGATLSGGAPVRDGAADAALPIAIGSASLDVGATQASAIVRPGDSVVVMAVRLDNRYTEARTLRRLALANRTTGPGTAEQRDRALGSVRLHLDDGDGLLGPGDTLLGQASAAASVVAFDSLALALPPGQATRVLVSARPPLDARDGDALDLRLESGASVTVEPAAILGNAWPVDPSGACPIDGMVAAQVGLEPVPARGVNPSSTDQLVLQVVVPANGYQADVLQSLAVRNAGTASGGADIARVRAWADDGDGAFDGSADRLLGTLAFTGDRWQLSGLSEPVPVGGARLFFTADLAPLATEGATLRFALPAGASPGVGMASANDGPLDAPVANPHALAVTNSDRVTFEAAPLGSPAARPGDRDIPLLQLLALNTYLSPRTLTSLAVTHTTSGPGSVAQRDAEVRQLVLREDGNGDGRLDDAAVDPVIGSGYFVNGRAVFNGLAVGIPAGGARRLFVTAELSRTAAADGDLVSARVAGPEDVDFSDPTTVAGAWPLDSGARVAVDGFSSLQVSAPATPSATVSPGDGPLLALDLVVPANGYRSDVLQGVRVRNTGTATGADIASMALWRDGGDGAFSPGSGDDAWLGAMTPVGADWRSPLLSEPVGGAGARLFVGVTLSGAAAESVTVNLRVPRDGIDYASGNDGPNDADVDHSGTLLVSTSPLLATLKVPVASTLGQAPAVRLVLRNVGAETIQDIVPGTLVASSGALVVSGGPSPASLTLAPGATDSVSWTCTASTPGEVRLDADAAGTGTPSGLPRRALRVSSGTHRVYVGSTDLDMVPVRTMPVNVNRGQADVIPFSLTLSNPGGAGSSDVRLQGLRVRLEDDAGGGIVPSDLLQRVTVSEGTSVYLVKTTLESAGAEVALPLATPAQVAVSEPTTLTLRLDILPTTVVPSFRVIVTDSLGVQAQDVTSLAPVAVRAVGSGYPVRSDVARVVLEATGVSVSPLAADTARVCRGAASVPLLAARFENPGVSGISSDVRLSAMGIELLDAVTGAPARFGGLLRALRVRSGAQVFLARSLGAADSSAVALAFSPPANLPANTPVDLTVEGDLLADAPLGRYRARLLPAAGIQARDATTRALVPVSFPEDSVAGGEVRVESPADTLHVSGVSRMPSQVLVGQAGVTALAATLRHPGVPGTARLRVDSLTFECRNESRAPLVPAAFLGRVRVLWNGGQVALLAGLPGSGGSLTVPLPGVMLEPGDSANVAAIVDVNAAAPTGWLELMLASGGIAASDINTGAPLAVVAAPGSALPVLSGLARIESPARLLSVGLDSRMPAVLAADGAPVVAGTLTLANEDSAASGTIVVDRLWARAADRSFTPLALGAFAERVVAWVDGALWAQSALLTPDSSSALLVAAAPLAIEAARPRTVELRFVPRAGAPAGGVRLGCDRADIGVVQPASALLAVAVQPRAGSAFPMWTGAGGFAAADLAGSYANFPNPFAAGREATRIVYFLRARATVSLEILSARGEAVATIVRGEPRAAGLHQADAWDGRNGRGETVYNGVYLARLTARYDDGTSESLTRKVAVVR